MNDERVKELANDIDEIRTKSYKECLPQGNMALAYYIAKELIEKGWTKYFEGACLTSVKEMDRLYKAEKELQELSAKYYNEAKDLRRKALLVDENDNALNDETIEYFVKHNAEVRKQAYKEVLDDLRGLLEGYLHNQEKVNLYEHYCKKYGVEE